MPEHTNTTTGTHRFEKNNFFYGKLLTVRDMAAEQAYHSGIQRTLSRYVTDWGVICGLDVTTSVVTDDETGQESLSVTVSEGLALDQCGRLLSVSDEQHESVTLPPEADGLATDTISVYVEYDECFTDPVPTAKMENACEEDCKDNRVVEEAEVIVEPGDPGDYHKPVADVEFPSAEDLGLADDHEVQTLDVVGDILLRGVDEEEGDTVSLDLSISDTAPSGTVNVDISPPQTGDPDALVGNLEVPVDAFIGPDGFVLPEGEFRLTGAVGEADSRMAVGGSLTATETGDGVSFEGTISFQSVEERFDIPIEFNFDIGNSDLGIDGSVEFPEVVFDAEGDLSATDRDDQYLLTGSTDVFRVTDEGEDHTGVIETTEWVDDSEEEISGVLLDRPETREEPDDDGIDLDEVLSGPARSYYENEPRTECPATTEGRILVGTITSEGADWTTTSFTYGPLVYTNDLLYDALVNHTADFDNPHGSVVSINGVGPDEDGDIRLTSDDTISVTGGTHSINLSATGGEGLPDEFQDYIFEKSLRCECNTFRDLTDQFDMDAPRDIAQILSDHLAAWRTGRADYLDVFEGETELHEREQDFQRELQQERWEFLGGVDHYGSAVDRLITLVNRDATPLEIAIAQLRVCEAAACLSGDCLSFERFPLPSESLRRPFTFGDYIVDSSSNLQLVDSDTGMRLRLPQASVLIDFPTTPYLELELVSDEWGDVGLSIVALDVNGDDHTIFEGEGERDWEAFRSFSIEEDDLTRIEIVGEGNDPVDLSRLCHR